MAVGTPVPGTPVPGIPAPVAPTHSSPIMASPSTVHDLVGTVLADRYRILKKLGEGGMGSVYLAEHTTINKRLAIKVLSPEYSHKQDLVDRFLQEARAASMIEQENVVEITDFGSTPGGSVFFAMEFLNGEDLAGTIKREGPLPWSRVRVMMLQVCTALSAAHAAGIIHRDMKPENCYRIKRGSNEDFIKVLDFGIAKVQSDEGDGGKGLTRTGMIFGTPEYMSPEQAKGEKVDHRVDIYAAGVILYELLTGRVPFTADTFMGILTKHMFEAPPAPSMVAPDCAVPPDVEAIILKALQKDRDYRFQSMAEMARAIEAVGTGASPVFVMREDVTAPRSGQIRFANNSTAIQLDGDPLDTPQPRSKVGLFVGLGVGAAVVALGGFFAMGGFGGDETPTPPSDPAPIVVAKADVPDDTKAPIAAPVVAPDTASVEVTIACGGLKAEVRSDADDGLLGYADAPIKLPRGTTALPVRLRAEGYQDLLVEITPDATKTISASLSPMAAVEIEPDAKKPHGTKKPSKPDKVKPDKPTKPDKPGPVATPSKPDKPASGETPTKPDKPVDPKKTPNGGSPDLKDPFGGH
jgi:tRNA A-37 threonylcarbamoyl transferase component Bud32